MSHAGDGPGGRYTMRIFFVCQRVPFPPDRGDKIVTFHEISHLSQQHELHVFCLADGADDLANVAGISGRVASLTAIPVSKWRSRVRSLAALVGSRPLSVAAFDEPKLHEAIIRKFDERRPDLIIVFSSNVAQYAEHFAGMPRIMQFHDLDSLKWEQFAASKTIPFKWVYRLEANRLLTYEHSIARRFSHALVCTSAERNAFESLFPGIAVSQVGNGVDLDYFHSSSIEKRPGAIVFTGVMDYFPNVDAVTWFCDEILPVVQAQVPEASLIICGSRPTAAVSRLGNRRGVCVTGWVPDTRSYLDAAEICVAPMRVGRGVQNKLLEALAMGLPCVATKLAWRGTGLPEGAGMLVSDDASSFAAHVTKLLQEPRLRRDMARRARAAAEAAYRWEKQLAALDRVVAEVTAWPRKTLKICMPHEAHRISDEQPVLASC